MRRRRRPSSRRSGSIPTFRQLTGRSQDLVSLLHGNIAEAIRTLEQARGESPGVDEIHILLAVAYAEAGRMDEARGRWPKHFVCPGDYRRIAYRIEY